MRNNTTVNHQTDTLKKFSLDIGQQFQHIYEWQNLSARQKNTGTTVISINPSKNKQQKGIATLITLARNRSTSSRANVSKEEESCDSISWGDESYTNSRNEKKLPSYSNKGKVRKLNKDINQEKKSL